MTNLPDLAALAEHAEAELPVTLRQRYRTAKRRGMLVLFARLLAANGMTWASLHRALAAIYDAQYAQSCADLPDPATFASPDLLQLVGRIEAAQPWPAGSAAPDFMRSLRQKCEAAPRVTLTPRQIAWLDALAEKAMQHELENLRPTAVPEGTTVH